MDSGLPPTGERAEMPGQLHMVTKQGSVAWDDTHTPRYWVAGGVQLQCVCGVAEGLMVDVSEDRGAQGSSPPAQCTGPEPAPSGAPAAPPADTWAGVFCHKRLFQKQERKRNAQRTEARARPGKLVLALFAVHVPICFVIAWLFLEATGVSRKPESVDCVSSVWGV